MNTIGKIIAQMPATLGIGRQKQSQDREPNKEQNSQQEREPTKEEAEKACQILAEFDSIKKSVLQVKVVELEGRFVIQVLNAHGQTLRSLKGAEVLRLLVDNKDQNQASLRGRLLDSRI